MNVLAGTFWQRIGAWIAPFREPDGPPPARILPFFRWSLAGTGFALAIGALAAAAAGSAEVISAMLLGLVIDMAEAAGPAKLFTGHGWAFAGIVTPACGPCRRGCCTTCSAGHCRPWTARGMRTCISTP